MCMDWVDEVTKQSKIGYKVFRLHNGKLENLFFNIKDLKKFNEGRWVKSHSNNFHYACNRRYRSGFHFFYNYDDAVTYLFPEFNEVIMKIEVKNIIASGYLDIIKHTNSISLKTGVAEKIKLIGGV